MAWWKEEPWRLVQTNLREIDMADISAERFVADLEEFHATVVLLNAAGISAGYDTALPFQLKNPYLHGDSLEKIVDLCHEHGIRVIARADFSKVRKEVCGLHPEWAFRTKDGLFMEQNGYVQTCLCGEYQQKYAFLILEELFQKIPFDGLYCNMGGFQTKDYGFKDYGFCHCKSCRDAFWAFCREELPESGDRQNPVWLKYEDFQKHMVREYRKKIAGFLKGISEDICFDDVDYARIEASTEITARLPHWIYHASSNCRAITGTGTSGIICSNTTVSYPGYSLRHASVSPALHAMRLWQNLANLGALDYYLIGRIDNASDRSAFAAVKRIFAFHHENEPYYRNLKSIARVLLRRKDRWVASEEEKGWIRVLTENHIPFAEILPDEMSRADLSRYRTVILADEGRFGEEEARRISDYVRGGGTVVAVGSNWIMGEADGWKQRPFPCSGILGPGRRDESVLSAQLRFGTDEKQAFPSHEEVDAFPVGDTYLFLEYDKSVKTWMKLIPPQPFGPPECCFTDEVWENPGLVQFEYGAGRYLAIPWLPGSFYSRTGHMNTTGFMRDVLLTHCGLQSVAPELTPMVEVTVAEDERGSHMVQLVNNSGAFGLSFFEPLPVSQAAVKLPTDRRPVRVFSLMGTPVEWRLEEYANSLIHTLSLKLERLGEYDAVRIEYEEGRSEA